MLNSTASPLSGLSALSGPPHFVDLHVNPGESVSIQLFDGNETILRGPATITMISQHTFPPIPMPVQVPPGHMIQQIVDENGTLRHIILSALNGNNNTSPSTGALLPQQPQQPFPYCCCCCYSCTGAAPTAPLPPPPPPPPPPQVHHNILAFPTPPNRRRINPMNRTFSPAGKRSAPTYFNNNSIGKSPIRHKLGTTATASVDGVSRVSFANKHTTPPDGKPYELNNSRVLVGRVAHNENNCLSDPKLVMNNTFINKESIERAMNGKDFLTNDGSIMSAPRPAPPFSYTSLEEHKHTNQSNDRTNCSHFESSEKPILLEINLSSTDSRPQNNISADIVEEVDEEEEQLDHLEQLSNEKDRNERNDRNDSKDNKTQTLLIVPENSLVNNSIDDKELESSRVADELSVPSLDSHEESLISPELEDLSEDKNQILEKNSNYISNNSTISRNTPLSSETQLIDTNSGGMADNQSHDKIEPKETSLSRSQSQSNEVLDKTCDSINQKERQSDKPENQVLDETVYSIEKSSENQIKESISYSIHLNEDEIEEVSPQKPMSTVTSSGAPVATVPPVQRSPKHLLPQLQLLNLTYTSLTANTVKLKWTHSQPHSASDLFAKHYVVEMLLNKLSPESTPESNTSTESSNHPNHQNHQPCESHNCRIVYQGHSNNCRISHLSSQQQYAFRVRTTSEEHLVVSNALTITTPEQQPVNGKYNKKSKRELLHQQIQQQQHQIHAQQLLLQQQQLQHSSQSRVSDANEPAISSDQRCAILLLLLFSLFALIVAVLIQQLLSD